VSRAERFLSLKGHAWLGKDYAKLSQKQLDECAAFLQQHSELTDNEFMHQLNRWKMDQPEARTKHYPLQWGLLSQSCETKTRRRGELA